MITKLNKILTKEDYALMLLRYSPVKGILVNPRAYSRQETEQAYIAYWRFMAEIVERYEIDDVTNWVISEYSGVIYEDSGG